MKNLIRIAICLLLYSNINGQTQGLVIQTGLTLGSSKDNNITKSGQAHYGWMVGADARILEGGMYFVIGGQYHNTNLISTKKATFFKNDWQMLMIRGGFGFNIISFSEKVTLRSKILGSINLIMDSSSEGLNLNGYSSADLNDSFLGATTGVGLTVGHVDIDMEYQYGILNAIYKKPDTKFSYFTLMVGFHF